MATPIPAKAVLEFTPRPRTLPEVLGDGRNEQAYQQRGALSLDGRLAPFLALGEEVGCRLPMANARRFSTTQPGRARAGARRAYEGLGLPDAPAGPISLSHRAGEPG